MQDVRFALRTLRRRPLTSVLAVLTLGLGVGGATAIFSVVDGVLVKELPFREPAGIVSIWKAWPSWQGVDGLDYVWDHIHIPWDDYLSVREGTTTLVGVAAHANRDMILTGTGEPARLSVGLASANLLDLLGVQPVLGRAFTPDEALPDGAAARVVLLSHEAWVARFGSDPAALERSIRLDEEAFRVVGVLPDGFRVPSDLLTTHENGGAVDAGLRDVWMPLGPYVQRCGNCLELLGRLAPGVAPDAARADVQRLLTRGPADQVARVVRRKAMVTAGFGTPLLVLLGAAGVLLLIACTNVAGLLLGEVPGRRREIAVRVALGAPRSKILGQLLTESVVLGLVGATLGVAMAAFATDALLSVAPPLPRLEEVGLDVRVLAFAATLGIGTGIVFGLLPALSLAGRPAGTGLTSRRGASDGGTRPIQQAVVGAQVAMTVLLLVAGGLFGRSLARIMAVEPGFDPEGLAVMRVEMPPGEPVDPAAVERFYARLSDALAGVSGVQSVATTNALPFPGGRNSQTFEYEQAGERVRTTQWARWVSPDYFETLGLPLVSGRLLSEADGPDDPRVMLVSESLAARNWPDESPLGATISYNGGRRWTVVGVVGDVRQKALGADVEATFYVSSRQLPNSELSLAVRVAGEPAEALPALRAAVWSVDPDIPISEAGTMRARIRDSEADDRFRALLMWTFSGLASVLAVVGIFSVTARSVAARSRELGIRAALGARASGLIGLVLREGLWSVVLGTLAGLAGAYALAGFVAHLLYGIESRDPATYGGVGGLMVAACLAAAYGATRRITRIPPRQVMAED